MSQSSIISLKKININYINETTKKEFEEVHEAATDLHAPGEKAAHATIR